MNRPTENGLLKLYITPEHPCSYLTGRQAKTVFVDPHAVKDPFLYQVLIDQGFRRSGDMIYRPECDGCSACIPVRIPVNQFRPNRTQRRTWRKNSKRITTRICDNHFNPEHFQLYERYIRARHADGDMSETSEQQYQEFLSCNWLENRFVEFQLDGSLIAVAVTDRLPSGLSALYTFFEPEIELISPGVYSILWQIEQAKKMHLPWLYLGYWIPECRKMAYKTNYRPIELYLDGEWRSYTEDIPITLAMRSKYQELE